MFGLLKKRRELPSSDGAAKIASVVRKLVGSQLAFSPWDEQDLLTSNFGLGYLMGLCDAMAQKQSIPEPEDLLVISLAFALLYPDHPKTFGRALQLAHDPEFTAGQQVGGRDFFGLASSDKRIPFGLVDYWKGEGFSVVH